MHTRTEREGIKRMISIRELCVYTGLGRNKAMEFAKDCGAEKHIGRRCLYDINAINRALDSIQK